MKTKSKDRMVIYKTTNLLNGKIYVGMEKRYSETYLGSGKHIKYALKKYGSENFKKEILQVCYSKEELSNAEIHWIEKLQATNPKVGYNISRGGDGGLLGEFHREAIIKANKNRVWSDKTKTLMRKRTKERLKNKENHPMYGKKFSEESRRKMSESQKKRPSLHQPRVFSETHKRNISLSRKGRFAKEKNSFFGKKHSLETRIRMSQTKQANKLLRHSNSSQLTFDW